MFLANKLLILSSGRSPSLFQSTTIHARNTVNGRHVHEELTNLQNITIECMS